MKFLFSDSLDYIDPDYDFVRDQGSDGRRAHADDDFPHEHLRKAPYDGLLISRAIVGDARRPGKYSEAQCMRFRREGVRAFLRFPEWKFPNSMVMGDCGAFSYRNDHTPPYSIDDTLDFYQDGGFTHGCSVDHLIFEFLPDDCPGPREARRRYEITLLNAEKFRIAARSLGRGFTALGVIQGWSARSMADSAKKLCRMGYTYLAVGGLVPLKIDQIERALAAIRDAIPEFVRLHLLGFGKTDQLERLRPYKISSFDTTSPLVRAFKDGRRNYYARTKDGRLDYYMAIRIPQAIDNDRLLRRAKKGHLDQDALLKLEAKALRAVRDYAKRRASLDNALDCVIAYSEYALCDSSLSKRDNARRLTALRAAYARTLRDRPWEMCRCRVCRESGVEALVFRSSNRNKRRGIHNLQVFYAHLMTENAARASI